MSQSSYLEHLNRDGFVVIPSVLTPSQITTLRTACKQTIDLARSGNWPYVRTLPKQFPPWNIESGANPAASGIWGVQFLMHPDLPNSKIFIENYFSDAVIDVVKELLECEDEELVMEFFNLLIRPDRDFELRWHRDDIPATATDEEELERLREPAYHAQWNLALYDDESLIVVPGSHKRARTAVERNCDPFEKGLPGEIRVRQKAGDVVFYNNNILHRGAYVATTERMTLHGSMGHSGGSSLRARNVLQHGIGEWVADIDLSGLNERESIRAEGMRQRLVKMVFIGWLRKEINLDTNSPIFLENWMAFALQNSTQFTNMASMFQNPVFPVLRDSKTSLAYQGPALLASNVLSYQRTR